MRCPAAIGVLYQLNYTDCPFQRDLNASVNLRIANEIGLRGLPTWLPYYVAVSILLPMSFLKGAWLFQVGPNGQNGNEIESASLAGSKDLPVP